MEGQREDGALADHHRMAVDVGEQLQALADLLDRSPSPPCTGPP